ncbi:MAG: triphosphoribosyl-dephospho-CoA synthase, partial [Lachnospiraceae bacterium]|nr:triphosphoribosyl-dephospho-CoA synthase [Lachnospiraceae bacterium]
FLSTKNINTHKGAIYLSILILASFTIEIFSKEKYDCTHCLLEKISSDIKNLVKENYTLSKNNSIANPTTHGDYVYKKYKTFGPREEAFDGIPHIIDTLDFFYDILDDLYNKNNINIINNKNIKNIYRYQPYT